MTVFNKFIEFADKFSLLYTEHAKWSQKTFGTDQERGPMAPLRHLEKEARECQDAVGTPELRVELADCLLLVLDSSRRAGMNPVELVEEAIKKLEVNKNRIWANSQADWVFSKPEEVCGSECQSSSDTCWRVVAIHTSGAAITGCGSSAEEATNDAKQKIMEEPVHHVE